MAAWFARRWQLLRELLAVALFLAGLGATVAWVVFGTVYAVTVFARTLVVLINWLR